MIELELTRDAEDYGRRVKRRYDRRGVTDSFSLDGKDKRWTGHAVEYVLHSWLTSEGFEHQWNGGLDNKPDFVLGSEPGIRVASKANSGDGGRSDFIFVVPEHAAHKLADGALFSIVGIASRRIWVAGYIDAKRFRDLSERRKKGDEGFVPGRPFEYACRTIRADALQPAEFFFDLMRRCA